MLEQLGPVEGGEGGEAAIDGHVVGRHQVRTVTIVQVGLQKLLSRALVFPVYLILSPQIYVSKYSYFRIDLQTK